MIEGAIFNPPKGDPVEVRTKAPVAVIINRMRFDQYLAKRGVAAGVTLHTKTRVSKFEHYSNGGIGLSVKDGPGFKGEVVIDASGAGSRLPEQAGLRTPDWSPLLPGLQYELTETKQQRDIVEPFFGNHRAPGFFPWRLPTGDLMAKVG